MSSKDRIISMKEVALHSSNTDAWMILFNNVYDVTPLMATHSGGLEVLLENAGRDASLVFQEVGHENVPLSYLKQYKIGVLPESEHFHLPNYFWESRIAQLSS